MLWAAATTHSGGHAVPAPLVPEAPNVITLLNAAFGESQTWGPVVHWMHRWENAIFAALIIGFLSWVSWAATRHVTRVPGPLQNVMEWCVEQLDTLVFSVIGERGRPFTPFVGTLFLYIIVMNFAGEAEGVLV